MSDAVVGNWILDQVGEAEPEGMTPAFLVISRDHTLHGSTGLNRFHGSWTFDEGRYFFEVTATTLMAGPPELMNQEQAVLESIATSVAATVSDDQLILADGDGQPLLRFVSGIAELPGTAWRAGGINNGTGGLASTATTGRSTLEFSTEGRITGSTGVNRFTGSYSDDGATLTFAEIAVTAATTTETGLQEQEEQYLSALERVVAWDLDGTSLILRDANGATLARFTPASEPDED
jgi:heat shock protein HslJ